MLYRLKRIVVFAIPLIILTACASAPTTQPAIPTQSSDTPGPASPQQAPSLLAALTANNVNVTVSGGQIAEKALQKFETLNVTAGNRILIDNAGRGVMRFGDRNEIDLFGDTEVVLDEAKLEPGGSTFLRLRLIRGHTHTLLNPQTISRVTLETADSTMTTLEQGTEFAVCFAPDNVTCLVVNDGSLEVTSQGSKQIYKKGEFTFFEAGQPPQTPNCIRQDEFNDWLTSKQSPADAIPLSQLVASWPNEPCPPEGPVVEYTPTPALQPTLTPLSTEPAQPTLPPQPTLTLVPTLPPQPTLPPTPYSLIHSITIDQNNHYVVEYETFGFTEQLPGMHVHFFFNTVPPEQAGVPGSGPWILYGGPRPFTQYTVNDRPAHATQMCILVANSDHSVQLNTGNCVDLP